MLSHTTERFRKAYQKLPEDVKKQAKKAYQLWSKDPLHPSLHFKQVHSTEPIYSVRIGLKWRALGIRQGNDLIWFWIGSHEDYNELV